MIGWRDVRLKRRLVAVAWDRGIWTPLAPKELLLGPPRGLLCSTRKRPGAQALTAVIDGERAIEVGADLDAEAGIAASARPGADLEEAPVELHGVIVLDGALVLEAADAIEVPLRWSRSPDGLGVRGGLGKARIVAWEKPVEHALGLGERTRLGEAELADEAILEGAKEPLDPPLALRGLRADPADAQFLEGAPDLGGLGPALELFSQGEGGAGIAVEDSMTVGVRRSGEAIAPDELTEEQEVAVGVLLQAEDAAEDLARGVVEGAWSTRRGPRSSSQGWWLPSIWTRRPAWGMRSRRRRWRGGRRVRGLPIPAARRSR
jgi:hypothetical protein